MQDLIAGRIDYFCSLAAAAIPQIESNALKAVVIFSRNRLPILPNLASMHEQGFTDFDVNPWYGFFLPRGTPAPVVKRLREASVATMATPSVQERLQELGYTLVSPDRRSSEYLQKFVESEIERWAAVIKTVGISPE
jgi:tripartite-type tricarboxylate transporter receptor subunit TctC